MICFKSTPDRTRTYTELDLNQIPLPIGLQEQKGQTGRSDCLYALWSLSEVEMKKTKTTYMVHVRKVGLEPTPSLKRCHRV